MFNYKVEIYENNAWTTLDNVALPITDGDVLDETLAEGRIDIKNTTRSKSIKPFTRLRIKCYDGETYKGKIQRVVGTTKKTRKRLVGTPTYDFEIQTLELTKLLERTIIGSMTSTKYINKNYSDTVPAPPNTVGIQYYTGLSPIENEYAGTIPSQIGGQNGFTGILINNPPQFRLYLPVGTIISSDASFITKAFDWYDTPTYPKARWVTEPQITLKYNGNTVSGYTLSNLGGYTIEAYADLVEYHGTTGDSSTEEDARFRVTITWNIATYYQKQTVPKTITSVVQRLLSVGKTRRKNETPKYALNQAFATKYSSIEAPEFAFTNDTLLDALFVIGGAIHAIPRLQCTSDPNDNDLKYEVTFDELGGDEDITANMPAMVYEDKNYDITDYCGALDSPAQNLVNSREVKKGCLTELGGQYITMRTETSQVEISSDTAAWSVSMPIHQMVRLYMLYDGTERDISAYVYEADEYATLSQLEESEYPYSTGWALCYKKGSNTITGFNNKLTTATILTKPGLAYAISNIWKAVAGSYIPSNDLINCAFRAVYVPIVEARITQRKPLTETDEDIELMYNQGSNLVETNAYGQKMRGAAARLGQEITRRTYDFKSLDNLPKVGQLIDGAYIAQCNCAYYATKVRVTVTMTPNFNLLSQYVGLNTNYRLSDISTEQITNRFITYGNTLVFGDSEANGSPIIPTATAKSAIAKMLKPADNADISRIDKAMFVGYDEEETEIEDSAVLLPVMSFPFGTSWAFVCACLDNYGAGYQATSEFTVTVIENGVNVTKHKRVQRLVPYSDGTGEIEYLGVWWTGDAVWENDATAIANGGQANIYPQATASVETAFKSKTMTTGSNPFVLEKDSKERIGVVYQMHLQANRDSVVIGSALADNCPLCTNYDTVNPPLGTAYVLPRTINTFGSVDLTGATNTTFTVNNGQIVVANPGIAGTKAWVIVDTQNNIYIGENTDENNGGNFPTIYISTK